MWACCVLGLGAIVATAVLSDATEAEICEATTTTVIAVAAGTATIIGRMRSARDVISGVLGQLVVLHERTTHPSWATPRPSERLAEVVPLQADKRPAHKAS